MPNAVKNARFIDHFAAKALSRDGDVAKELEGKVETLQILGSLIHLLHDERAQSPQDLGLSMLYVVVERLLIGLLKMGQVKVASKKQRSVLVITVG